MVTEEMLKRERYEIRQALKWAYSKPGTKVETPNDALDSLSWPAVLDASLAQRKYF